MSEASTDLFDPVRVGPLTLRNRVVMAAMTRARAEARDTAGPLHVEYYAQRATAGLIISEGISISPNARGYYRTPGLYTPEQIESWRAVTDAVHTKGGHIQAQLWHVGRISHTAMLPTGMKPVAPSAVRADSFVYAPDGFLDCEMPEALTIEGIRGVIEEYRTAAINAIAAGFDGVQIHAGNGYLLDQFLRDGSNFRGDEYGGSIDNRARLLVEVTEAVCGAVGADLVSVRIAPLTAVNDISDSDPEPLFRRVVEKLGPFGLAFLDVIEGATTGPRDVGGFDMQILRRAFPGLYMGNNGYNRELALEARRTGTADLIGFGRAFIGNPDLIERLQQNLPLAPDNRETYYGGGREGFTDYPTARELEMRPDRHNLLS